MEFDPSELVKKKEGAFSAPDQIPGYLDKRMKWCLTKDEHEALIKDHRWPDSVSCKVPALDKYVKEFLGKKSPKEEDRKLAKIPAAALLTDICMELLASLWGRWRPRHASSSIRDHNNDSVHTVSHWKYTRIYFPNKACQNSRKDKLILV